MTDLTLLFSTLLGWKVPERTSWEVAFEVLSLLQDLTDEAGMFDLVEGFSSACLERDLCPNCGSRLTQVHQAVDGAATTVWVCSNCDWREPQ